MKWFVLSRALGLSVREAQNKIDSYEFSEWIIMLKLNPTIEDRADINASLIRRTLYSINAKNQSDIPRIDELMIDYTQKQKTNAERVKEKLLNWKRAKG